MSGSRRAPSQFYTGLVAELYEPLASRRPRAGDYVPLLERSGTPALELACGSGMPLLDLVARGYDVEGLDASRDMLRRCRARAAERGLDVTLHSAGPARSWAAGESGFAWPWSRSSRTAMSAVCVGACATSACPRAASPKASTT